MVFRPIDHAHPTSSEFLENAIVGDGLPVHGLRFGHA
jgi:hypothetical protein